MPERELTKTWVEVHRMVLTSGERARQAPDDTRQVPLEMKVTGFMLHDAVMGEEVGIMTLAGRTISGVLTAVNPGYTHTFGPPISELSSIGREVRTILRNRGNTA